MSLEHLWAGWRSAYVGSFGADSDTRAENAEGLAAALPERLRAVTSALSEGECIFCAIFSAEDLSDAERLVVWRGERVLAMLNAYPYTTGHLMVMPVRHLRDLEELTSDEATQLWSGVKQAVAAIKAAYHPDGANIGLNLGRAAGAGIPGHLHVHVVPRWLGDTNFMTAVASVRVLPEALPESWEKVSSAWQPDRQP